MAMHEVPIDPTSRKAAHCEPSVEAFKVNGMTPFRDHRESAAFNLQHAHALLTVMQSAFRESGDEGVNAMYPAIIASALDGVAALVALGLHQMECADALEAAHA